MDENKIKTIKPIFAQEFDLRETIGNSDIAGYANQIINRWLLDYPAKPIYDNNWMELFTEVTTDKQMESFPTKAGLNVFFQAIGENEEPKFATITDGTLLNIYNIKYRAAVRFANEVIKFNQKARFEWFMRQMQLKGLKKISQIMYGTIIAGKTAGTNPTANTTAAVAQAINTTASGMINAGSTDDDGYFPTHILCNPNQVPIIKKALMPELLYANLERNLKDTDINPLLDEVYNLKIISSREITNKKFYLIEAQRYLIALKDSTEGDLMLDSEVDKLHDSQNIYGKFYKGAAVLDGNAVKECIIP